MSLQCSLSWYLKFIFNSSDQKTVFYRESKMSATLENFSCLTLSQWEFWDPFQPADSVTRAQTITMKRYKSFYEPIL